MEQCDNFGAVASSNGKTSIDKVYSANQNAKINDDT